MPALFTSTSSLPKRAMAVSTAASPVVIAGDVQMHVDRLAARLGDAPLHRAAFVVQHVAEDHAGALGGEQLRLQRPLAPRAA